MTTAVDICNLGLSHVGDGATITALDGTDTSVQATHCARYWPIARDQALAAHPWAFAIARAELPAATSNSSLNWSYAYQLPDDCLRVLNILTDETNDYGAISIDAQPIEFREEVVGADRVLYTNEAGASIRYISRQVNADAYTAAFVGAVSLLLASYLVGPLVKGKAVAGVAQGFLQRYEYAIAQASALDAKNNRVNARANLVPAGIRARA